MQTLHHSLKPVHQLSENVMDYHRPDLIVGTKTSSFSKSHCMISFPACQLTEISRNFLSFNAAEELGMDRCLNASTAKNVLL